MKVVILAGGLGTRLGEETSVRPKPLVEIGGQPILWHIMKSYSYFGHNEFIICLGYKGFQIKEFFINYMAHLSDMTVDFTKNETVYNYERHYKYPWRIHLVHTGDNTMTGSRIFKIKDYIGDDQNFLLTYGDGLSDVNINEEIEFHKLHKKVATVLAVKPQGRFGALEVDGDSVCGFIEKPKGDNNYISGGFFVLNRGVFDYLSDDNSLVFEQKPLSELSKHGELKAYFYDGFWQCMDTVRDKNYLEELWKNGEAPWKKF